MEVRVLVGVLLWENLIGYIDNTRYRCRGLSKVVRVRYEKGVLRPLEKLDLKEGEELVVFIHKRRVGEVLNKYVGIFGKATVEELKIYEEEAQA